MEAVLRKVGGRLCAELLDDNSVPTLADFDIERLRVKVGKQELELDGNTALLRVPDVGFIAVTLMDNGAAIIVFPTMVLKRIAEEKPEGVEAVQKSIKDVPYDVPVFVAIYAVP